MDFLYNKKEMLEKMIEVQHAKFDPEYGMITRLVKGSKGAYHTNYTGLIHHTRDSAEYINKVCYMKKSEYYGEVRAILNKLAVVQDSREGSPTYGLWGYVCEEPIEDMLAPDYNNADFTGKHIAYVLKHCPEALDEESTKNGKLCLTRAATCSINRNVSADYTNISFMSLNTIIGAGELCDRPDMFETGKKRLKKAYEYQKFNGGFSEFNSPTYSPLVIEELGRLMTLTDDEEITKMAKELIYMAWDEILCRYDKDRRELCPPMMRAYRTSAFGMIEELLYSGTQGRYGNVDNFMKNGEKEPLFVPELLALDNILCPEDLVDKYLKNSLTEAKFIEKTFYKKNNIRSEGEDTVIVRNLNSPDLSCYGYMTPVYSMGAFKVTDMWTQRRSSVVTWGKDDDFGAVRVRCFNYDYDFCSGIVCTNQYENGMLSHTGFATDRGDFHYILDNVIAGRSIKSQLTTKKLFFKFCLEGTAQNAKVTQNGNSFIIDSGDVRVYINIYEAVFDGAPMDIFYNEETKEIEAVCFDEEKTVDFAALGNCYMVFTMSVNEEMPAPVTKVSDGKVESCVEFSGKKLSLSSFATPKAFDDIVENTKTSRE